MAAGAMAQTPMVSAPAATCSVGLYAQQRSAGVTVWTTALEDVVHPPRQRRGVHVVVTHPDIAIRSLTVRVSYLPYGLRAIPTDAVKHRDMQEQSRTFTVYPKEDAEVKSVADLLLGLVSGVRSVSVESIEYADGSTWKAPAVNPCRVTPSGYVEVNGTAH